MKGIIKRAARQFSTASKLPVSNYFSLTHMMREIKCKYESLDKESLLHIEEAVT